MFPKKLKICNQVWTVEICDIHAKLEELNGEKIEDLVDEDEAVLGFCATQKRLICVEKNMCRSAQIETMIHEIGHAYYSCQPSNWGTEHDEQWARMFASSVLDLYVNNKTDWIEAG